MNIPAAFEQRGKGFWTLLALVLIVLLGLIDLYTGPEIAFALFYLIPVSLLAWFSGRGLGVFISFVSAGVWLLVVLLTHSLLERSHSGGIFCHRRLALVGLENEPRPRKDHGTNRFPDRSDERPVFFRAGSNGNRSLQEIWAPLYLCLPGP